MVLGARRGRRLLAGRGFGWLGCYVRDDDDRVYETYWTTDRGNEAGFWSYGLLDRTVFGRLEPWEDSVDGRPLAQWDVTYETVRRLEDQNRLARTVPCFALTRRDSVLQRCDRVRRRNRSAASAISTS